MVDVQYDTVLAVLYAAYSPAQIPSNMVSSSIHAHARASFKLFQGPQLYLEVSHIPSM